jgi:uncharacterized membrane protein YdjX (TVP38/TMEM64 family)
VSLREDRGRRRAAWRLGGLAAAVVALLVAGVLAGVSPASVAGTVRSAGPLAPVAFVLLGATLACLLFPGHLTATLAGALFGIGAGLGLALAAFALGAACAFVIARLWGARAAERVAGARIARLRAWVGEHGFGAVLASRLLPGGPAGVVNYAAGVSGMRLLPFVAAVALGALPKTFAYVALGGALSDPVSARGAVALAIYLAAAVAGLLLARRGLAGLRAPRPG